MLTALKIPQEKRSEVSFTFFRINKINTSEPDLSFNSSDRGIAYYACKIFLSCHPELFLDTNVMMEIMQKFYSEEEKIPKDLDEFIALRGKSINNPYNFDPLENYYVTIIVEALLATEIKNSIVFEGMAHDNKFNYVYREIYSGDLSDRDQLYSKNLRENSFPRAFFKEEYADDRLTIEMAIEREISLETMYRDEEISQGRKYSYEHNLNKEYDILMKTQEAAAFNTSIESRLVMICAIRTLLGTSIYEEKPKFKVDYFDFTPAEKNIMRDYGADELKMRSLIEGNYMQACLMIPDYEINDVKYVILHRINKFFLDYILFNLT